MIVMPGTSVRSGLGAGISTTSPPSASSTGTPAGRNGVVASAIAAPSSAALRVRGLPRSDGSTSASRAAGNAASRPNASVSPMPRPASAPASVPRFHPTNAAVPSAQNTARERAGSFCAMAKATDSSISRWLPTIRASDAAAHDVAEREAERQVPGVEQQRAEHGRHQPTARGHHADHHELRAAREDEQRQQGGHPPRQPARHRDRAEGQADDRDREDDREHVAAQCQHPGFAISNA